MNPDTAKYLAKGFATVAAACLCLGVSKYTKGESGPGWFAISLILIWNAP